MKKIKIMIQQFLIVFVLMASIFSCSEDENTTTTDDDANPNPNPEVEVSYDIPEGEPEDLGFDAEEFPKVDSRAALMERLHSLLVIKNDTLVFENYYNNFSEGQASNLKSSSKSILNLLIGIAIEEGFIESIDETLYDYVPEIYNDEMDPRKKEITIEHLMTMTSGLESTSLDNYSGWTNSDDWLRYALELPMEADPGEWFAYSTGDTHLLSAIITEATGMSSLEFAQQYLYEPMEIEVTRWDEDPQGYNEGGNNVYVKPYDLAKIGIMVKNGGVYRDKRIVPEDWIEESIKFQVEPQGISRPFEIEGYGYLWWLVKANQYSTYSAIGHGGQYMMTIPDLDMIVVLTSLSQGSTPGDHFTDIASLVEDYILASLEE
ncbi:serine hydrolase domain-containing protein [Autumnicola musiva]|uniref:Serine hydrolase n=1 Tax=Autumnicola musiva TaxID=3075589 RepID=A0ABU3D8V9_9FLAO|nr:serine hydrolase [Zunongwangia sp. F117]MDT0677969.1 serine hydrolase [Zunongwangia sp. F117]